MLVQVFAQHTLMGTATLVSSQHLCRYTMYRQQRHVLAIRVRRQMMLQLAAVRRQSGTYAFFCFSFVFTCIKIHLTFSPSFFFISSSMTTSDIVEVCKGTLCSIVFDQIFDMLTCSHVDVCSHFSFLLISFSSLGSHPDGKSFDNVLRGCSLYNCRCPVLYLSSPVQFRHRSGIGFSMCGPWRQRTRG